MVARRYEFYVGVARTSCCHKNKIHIFELARNVFLLYRHTDEGVFDDLPKISNHFAKISKDFPKLFQRLDEHFWTLSKDYRRRSEDVSIIHQQALLDLITVLLKCNCFLSTTVAMQCIMQCIDDSLTTHLLLDDLMILIWKFAQNIEWYVITNVINKNLP